MRASVQQDAEGGERPHELIGNKVKQEESISPAMIAFVDAMAGMIFFTTPCVDDHVTPSILNSFARAEATS